MAVLVTGGAGYIGTHTCLELMSAGYEVVIVDNLVNSKETAVERVKQISGREVKFYKIDILDKHALEDVFRDEKIDSVIHFAGLKAVGESVSIPLKYYHNNLTGTLILLELMQKYQVKNFVFSSSATVYGNPVSVPISEEFALSATNPYGRTKLMIEEILHDLHRSDNSWNIALLRYFNPIGAHSSGLIGEDPNGIPNNLIPYITQVAVGKHQEVKVFGNDYSTNDGTGVRDYIHVVDLAKGHVKAIEKLIKEHIGIRPYNLGTGKGYSVLEMIQAFSKACNKDIPYKIVGRRPGDIAACYAKTDRAQTELGWTAEKSIDEMCRDSWRWQSQNPEGYK